MTRRAGLPALIVALLVFAGGSGTVHAARKVGMLIPLSTGVSDEYEDTYVRHIRKFYQMPEEVELVITVTRDDSESRLAGLRSLMDQGVGVLLCFGSSATMEAASTFSRVPIVFVGSYDPLGMGLVEDLEKPGKNVTGVTGRTSLAVLIESVLEVTAADNLGVLFNSDNRDSVAEMDEIRKMGGKMSFSMESVDLKGLTVEEMPSVFQETEFILMTTGCCGDTALIPYFDDLMKPVACWTPTTLCEGAVFSYALDLEEIMSAAAVMTYRVLDGKSPAEVPVKFIKKRRFIVDMKKAKQLNLKIPYTVFKHATSVSK